MSGDAIVMMVIGMIIIWGGLAASLANAVIKSKRAK
ncbi:methionine/alanine import family NSS transporter small subunit [Bacillus sp. FJAT-27225]|nr:methionine/alanine import family NSS transporter small subunit [Bacillus sp. FJAT-27225]